jgi:hypothetical protein
MSNVDKILKEAVYLTSLQFEFPYGQQISAPVQFRQDLRLNQLPIQVVPETLPQGVKRPGYQPHHSPPTSTDARRAWISKSTPSYVFMA